MSEHKINTTRYWDRQEPDGTHVLFISESNAAHSRAESDPHATEIDREAYEASVPEEARERPYDATNAEPAALGSKSQAEVIAAYRAACAKEMIAVHGGVLQMLTQANITHAERIFILEMVKTELTLSMMAPQQQAH